MAAACSQIFKIHLPEWIAELCFKCICLRSVSTGPIGNKSTLFKKMAWHRTGQTKKPLNKTMVAKFTDTCMRHSALMSWILYRSHRMAINKFSYHYDDVIITTIAAQITSLPSVYSTVYSGPDQSKHQSSASLAFVWGIHRGPVNSPHKWPVTRKMFPFDDVIMFHCFLKSLQI